jgi:hypothetical protein
MKLSGFLSRCLTRVRYLMLSREIKALRSHLSGLSEKRDSGLCKSAKRPLKSARRRRGTEGGGGKSEGEETKKFF